MVSRLALDERPERDFVRKGSALIRRQFGIETTTLSEEKWAALYSQAKWMHDHETNKLANLISVKVGEVVLRAMGYKFESD